MRKKAISTLLSIFLIFGFNFCHIKNAYASGTVWSYSVPGAYSLTLQPGQYKLEVWGAQGGSYVDQGGWGGYSEGILNVTTPKTVYILVGGQGGSYVYSRNSIGGYGGFNGGGNVHNGQNGGGGGGATDIRTQFDGHTEDSLNNRIIVAGGGGGVAFYVNSQGGAGGGVEGQSEGSSNGSVAGGGTQSQGGSAYGQPGTFGMGGSLYASAGGGGGGGGWYGGGSGFGGAGGGGSGYIGGVQDGQTIMGYSLMPSPNGGTEYGQWGNGYARITSLDTPPILSVSTPVSNTQYGDGETMVLSGSLYDSDGSNGNTMSVHYSIDSGDTTGETLIDTTYSQSYSINISLPNNLSYGNHTLNVWATDSQGAISSVQSVTFNVVQQFPFITFQQMPRYIPPSVFTSQAQGSTYGGDLWVTSAGNPPNGTSFFESTFNVSQTEDVTFSNLWSDDYVQVYVDGTPIMQEGGSGGVGTNIPYTPSTTLSLAPGEHQVVLESMNNDGFGTPLGNPAGVSLTVSAGAQTILSTATPSEWRMTGYISQLPNGWMSGAVGSWNWIVYTLQINQSQPIYSQQSYSQTVSNLNATAPSTPTLNVSTSSWTNQNVTFAIDGSMDANYGIEKYQYQIDNGNWTDYPGTTTISTEGHHTVSARALNNAGVPSAVVTKDVSIDKSAPSLTLTPSTTSWTQGETVNVSASDSLSGVNKIQLPDGSWVTGSTAIYDVAQNGTFTFNAIDNTGNTQSQSITVSNIDNTPPDLTITPSTTNWVNQPLTLNATASDSQSGVSRVQTPDSVWHTGSSVTYSVSKNGAYSFVAEDNAGNSKIYSINVNNIDTTPPIINALVSPANWTNLDAVITLTTSDAGSGIKDILMPDGNYVNASSLTYTATLDGDYTFTVYDDAGNYSTKTVHIGTIDKTAPGLALTPSTTNWTNQNILITAQASDDLSGVNSITMPDNTIVNGTTATYTATENETYSFIVTDMAGNETTQAITIANIDKVPPTLTVIPNTSQWVSGTVTLTVRADDTISGVQSIQLPDGNIINNSSVQYNISSNGTYSFTSLDNAENSTTVSITVNNIDLTAPTAPIINANSAWINQPVTVSITPGIDSQSGVNRTEYRLDGATTQDWTAYSQPIIISKEGITTVSSRTIDNVGWDSNISSAIVRIDKTPPSNASITIIPKQKQS